MPSAGAPRDRDRSRKNEIQALEVEVQYTVPSSSVVSSSGTSVLTPRRRDDGVEAAAPAHSFRAGPGGHPSTWSRSAAIAGPIGPSTVHGAMFVGHRDLPGRGREPDRQEANDPQRDASPIRPAKIGSRAAEASPPSRASVGCRLGRSGRSWGTDDPKEDRPASDGFDRRSGLHEAVSYGSELPAVDDQQWPVM